MVCPRQIVLSALCSCLIAAQLLSAYAQSLPQEEKKERKQAKEVADNKPGSIERNHTASRSDTVEIVADRQSKLGNIFIADGYVIATAGDFRLQADHVTYNEESGDMVAEGNVIFDEGTDQRVTARRAEINWTSRRGTFWDTTGFTNRTQTGEYLYFTAERIEKTGAETYVLYNATVTACEEALPKWTFSAKRANLKVGDRVKLYNSVFRIRNVPFFLLPFTWIPVTKKERKSGFLLPTTGTSTQKGRTLKFAYYQTLGDSADITLRGDVYTKRGIGMGAEFRARTDEKSYLRMGIFNVRDRLFAEAGENQGGTAFVAEAIQYLPKGWLAVGSVSLVTSLAFRQVFSDDISQVIDPRRESTLYLNNNTGNFSFNLLASNLTTTIFRPGRTPSTGTNFDIKVRQAPAINLLQYPRRIFNLPIYFSFDSSLDSLKREEAVDNTPVLATPAAVQRFDFQPKITVKLATFAGIAITPSLSLRETFYTNSVDPTVRVFNPDRFAATPADPRLNPTSPSFRPGLKLFDRRAFDRILPESISRRYAELAVDIRPPAFEKPFFNDDGTQRFKHLIEPYITYRLIGGIGKEFDKIIRFDERDAVANTNEFEYALVNRFFLTRSSAELVRKPKKGRNRTLKMEPERPGKAKSVRQNELPLSLETGKQAEMSKRGQADQTDRASQAADEKPQSETYQAYEFLTIRVAQKYFFDRNFGGALVPGRRNQFYPLDTLSGFTYGGRARSFSPLNLAVYYRPLSSVFADLRMDIGPESGLRNMVISGGVHKDKLRIITSWYLSRKIEIEPNRFEPGTFSGNQLFTTLRFGDETRGLYGGTRFGYDFTNRFITETLVSKGRLTNTRSYIGYSWDCCGLQFNYNTFKAGLRHESHFSFTFTLAGLGSFGTDQFSQIGGGRGGRKRGKKLSDETDLP
jgi:LPS-assembly protein